jgi:hypothetical protein
MRLRRLVALLTAATMLHLSAVAGDRGCGTHAASVHQAAKADGTVTAEHTMPMTGHTMPAGVRSDAPAPSTASIVGSHAPLCEIPLQQHCCEAVAGCGAIGVVTSADRVPSVTVAAAARIREALNDAPPSFAPAPEPPPPKA